MKILSIETSCDETAISIVEASKMGKFKVLGNSLFSQAKLHEEFGGVFPNLARREHQKNLMPLLFKVLKIKKLKAPNSNSEELKTKGKQLEALLAREPELLEQFKQFGSYLKKPKIDRIAVTVGPGLEPALWVGISFAKALSVLWNIPLVPVNHMKGHFLSPLAESKNIEFPALGLLISGGHTELVLARSPVSYKIIGRTLDDACGEAYDKAARILGLPYPGGPEIAHLATQARSQKLAAKSSYILPRPMINSKNLDFSFSGLKTAVLYMVQKIEKVDEQIKMEIAAEFEESVKDVLVHKTRMALETNKVKTLLIGGGVSANTYIKKNLENLAKNHGVKFLASSKSLATDNAVMIGIAGFFAKPKPISKIKAEGNLSI